MIYTKAPLSVRIAQLAVTIGILLILINFLTVIVRAFLLPRDLITLSLVLILISLTGSILLPIIALVGLRRGFRSAPILVSVVCAWSVLVLARYHDWNAVVSAATSIVAVCAVWAPKSRGYWRGIREVRRIEAGKRGDC